MYIANILQRQRKPKHARITESGRGRSAIENSSTQNYTCLIQFQKSSKIINMLDERILFVGEHHHFDKSITATGRFK